MEHNYYILACPHCDQYVQIYYNELHCHIFRHAAYKHNKEHIPPHSDQKFCEDLVAADKIYGCGKPFRVISRGNELVTEICDYI